MLSLHTEDTSQGMPGKPFDLLDLSDQTPAITANMHPTDQKWEMCPAGQTYVH